MKPRPLGTDYSKPDNDKLRCLMCNKDGFNRTGLFVLGLIGTSTTRGYGVRCPEACNNGLIGERKVKRRMV